VILFEKALLLKQDPDCNGKRRKSLISLVVIL